MSTSTAPQTTLPTPTDIADRVGWKGWQGIENLHVNRVYDAMLGAVARDRLAIAKELNVISELDAAEVGQRLRALVGELEAQTS